VEKLMIEGLVEGVLFNFVHVNKENGAVGIGCQGIVT